MDAIDGSMVNGSSRRRRWRLLVAIGVALGLAVAVVPRAFGDDGETERTPAAGAVRLGMLSRTDVATATRTARDTLDAADATDPPAPPAATPVAAVEAFLAAEVAGRYDESYGLLSEPDRLRAGGRVGWAADHADLLPLTGFRVQSTTAAGDEVIVTTQTDLRAGLDEVLGLVPAHAQGDWRAVPEDGGWRVAHARSRIEPQHPSEVLATAAAHRWVTARQQCRTAAEWSGGLLGSTAAARRLCRQRGAIVVGEPTELLDDPSTTALTAAFGPDAYAWARRVPVQRPARLDLILAPVGEQWLVVAATKASASAS